MSHERHHTSRTGDALVAHRPHGPASSVAAPVERRMKVDPCTNARSMYQRGPDGSEMYASYYNSNDDPTFQKRFNSHKNGGAFVQSAQFTFMSHGGVGDGSQFPGYRQRHHGARQEHPRHPVMVEESMDEDMHEVRSDTGDDTDVHAKHRAKVKSQSTKGDPIVEEPDDDGKGYHDSGSRTHRHGGKKGERGSHRDTTHDAYPTNTSTFLMDPWGVESIMERMMQPPLGFGDPFIYAPQRAHAQSGRRPPSASYGSKRQQLIPYTRGGVMGGPFTDDFFGIGSPENPFCMMEAMRHHMQQQRAAMFGGTDPFARVFPR
ncbi:conserved hypothetical protein [Leishmania braziliensis MHOM/BR/75/M2904]|uniref:Uncharacterized protein n=2 Tax=Leishmania braziliensis TaxID=5660 RepID=A4H6C7_LEIBR|nr:conserved hypothetical protein [Leishmania braziliensis MHOM/BR/75/M2904]CAJ2467121.1 unnamed protein product [Leishmania braziliensis]CAM37351.1 conserved hypothetical protein [Leishmania braziliensis MHOM/BR/75/M2904]SYZ63175.1 hypothetical_protein [Leishmania braziliensis MHOM/BR/75/M2904]